MKKKLIIGVVIILILCSFLPIPQTISKTFYGVNTQNDEKVNISIDMKYLKFLFLKDKLSGTITVDTDDGRFTYGDFLHYTSYTSMNDDKDMIHNFSGWYYNDTMYMREYEDGVKSQSPVGMEPVLVHINSSFDKILVLHNTNEEISGQEKGRYIGSSDKSKLEETKEYFIGFYN